MIIRMYDNFSTSPAYRLRASAMLELDMNYPHVSRNVGPVNNDPCLVSFSGGEVLGFLVYSPDLESGRWWVVLTFVHPGFRRKGVATELFNALKHKAAERGDILTIDGATHPDNRKMIAAYEKQGRVLDALVYTYRIKDEIDGVEYRGLE